MRKLLRLWAVLAVILSVSACTNVDELEPQKAAGEETVMTKSIANPDATSPYSWATMFAAAKEIAKEDKLGTIHPPMTHHSMRMQPRDSTDYYLLDSLGYDYFPFPLDKRLSNNEMQAYINGEAGDGHIYFTRERDDERLAEIPNDVLIVLETLCMPDLSLPNAAEKYGTTFVQNYDKILQRALVMSGNVVSEPGTNWEPARVNPSARICYEDETGEIVPLRHVSVYARHYHMPLWQSTTDIYGRATGPVEVTVPYASDITFLANFSGYDWRIMVEGGDAGVYSSEMGTVSASGFWDVVIKGESKAAKCAAIHRGLQAYFYEDHPETDGIVKIQDRLPLQIKFLSEQNYPGRGGDFSTVREDGCDIRIFGKYKDGGYCRKKYIMEILFHELGHASHWQTFIFTGRNTNNMFEANKKVTESYAEGVMYLYCSLLSSSFKYTPSFTSDENYTLIVKWLMYSGFTFRQIHDAAMGSTWEGWRKNIKNLNVIPDIFVDLLFDYPKSLWLVDLRDPIGCYPEDGNRRTNEKIKFSLTQANIFNGKNVYLINWTVSDPNHEVVSQGADNNSLELCFRTPGVKHVTVTLSFPDGSTYMITKTVEIATATELHPSSEPFVGVPITYTLGTAQDAQKWSVLSSGAKDYKILSQTPRSITIIYFSGGMTYTIQAKIKSGYTYTSIEGGGITVAVPNDGVMKRVLAYRNDEYPYDIRLSTENRGWHYTWDGVPRSVVGAKELAITVGVQRGADGTDGADDTFPTIYPPYDPGTDPTHFYTYTRWPRSTNPYHPYYISELKIVTIYENNYHNGGYSFDKIPYEPEFWCNGIKFYVSPQKRDGLVPLYQIEETSTWRGNVNRHIRYLTTENLDSQKDIIGGGRVIEERKNMGIIGYVLPATL